MAEIHIGFPSVSNRDSMLNLDVMPFQGGRHAFASDPEAWPCSALGAMP